jgi:starch phosphorylase
MDFYPRTFIFGAKAAPGYHLAKRIIQLISMLSRELDANPKIREKLRVIFVEDYNVSAAECLIPAAEISQQISMAGKEASGTGCMKLMINGALTIGTLDGANVEMHAAVGDDNIYIFGLNAAEVEELWLSGYTPALFYARNEKLRRIIDRLNVGFAGESFADIATYLISPSHGVADPYLCIADFDSYNNTHGAMYRDYLDREKWTRMSLVNIAKCGYFAADRAVAEYADKIWHLNRVPVPKAAPAKTTRAKAKK